MISLGQFLKLGHSLRNLANLRSPSTRHGIEKISPNHRWPTPHKLPSNSFGRILRNWNIRAEFHLLIFHTPNGVFYFPYWISNETQSHDRCQEQSEGIPHGCTRLTRVLELPKRTSFSFGPSPQLGYASAYIARTPCSCPKR